MNVDIIRIIKMNWIRGTMSTNLFKIHQETNCTILNNFWVIYQRVNLQNFLQIIYYRAKDTQVFLKRNLITIIVF